MEAFYTIGVYGFGANTFYLTLKRAGVDLLIDLRRRRGVRGREYAFANSKRLQQGLQENGIRYAHVLALAPDADTRAYQHVADTREQIARRKREVLSDEFVEACRRQALEPFDWDSLAALVEDARRPALLCVERLPTACHRSLVAGDLITRMGVQVVDLVP